MYHLPLTNMIHLFAKFRVFDAFTIKLSKKISLTFDMTYTTLSQDKTLRLLYKHTANMYEERQQTNKTWKNESMFKYQTCLKTVCCMHGDLS